MYYHVSTDKELTSLTPIIPRIAVGIYEDLLIPRVCFSSSVDGCLSARQQGEGIYYVYMMTEKMPVYIPSINQVRDAEYTGEVWVLQEVPVKLIGRISVDDYTEKEIHKNKNGEVTVFCYPWEWKYMYDVKYKEYY